MGKVEKCGNWVPHELNERQQEKQKATSEILLARHERKRFFHRILMGDEEWVYFDNPKRKNCRSRRTIIIDWKAKSLWEENNALRLLELQECDLLCASKWNCWYAILTVTKWSIWIINCLKNNQNRARKSNFSTRQRPGTHIKISQGHHCSTPLWCPTPPAILIRLGAFWLTCLNRWDTRACWAALHYHRFYW